MMDGINLGVINYCIPKFRGGLAVYNTYYEKFRYYHTSLLAQLIQRTFRSVLRLIIIVMLIWLICFLD